MKTCTIYHNPRCSKSRETLALIQAAGYSVTVRDYLNEAPTLAELQALLKMLALPATSILRTDETEWKSQGLNASEQTETTLLAAIVACPKLLQRPIVVVNERAVIGRPPENVRALLD